MAGKLKKDGTKRDLYDLGTKYEQGMEKTYLMEDKDPFLYIANGQTIEFLRAMEAGCNVRKFRWSGFQLIHRAAATGQTDMVEILLQHGPLRAIGLGNPNAVGRVWPARRGRCRPAAAQSTQHGAFCLQHLQTIATLTFNYSLDVRLGTYYCVHADQGGRCGGRAC